MTISIIIPTYNEAENIVKTLRHLRIHGNQEVLEYLVADAGSVDKTVELAISEGAVVVACSEKGRAVQMNQAARQALGDILYFVHADTLPPATYVQDMVKALEKGASMGNFRYRFDSNSRLLAFNAWFTRFPWLVCQGGDKTFFIRKETFFELGAYDPGHVVMEEYDFIRRAQKAGYQLAILPALCLVSARKYEQNSYFRVQMANFLAYNLWSWGLAKPPAVKKIYSRILRPAKPSPIMHV